MNARTISAALVVAAAAFAGGAASARVHAPSATGPTITAAFPTPLPAPTPIVLPGVPVLRVPDFGARALTAATPAAAEPRTGNIGGESRAEDFGTDPIAARDAIYAQRMTETREAQSNARAIRLQLRRAAP